MRQPFAPCGFLIGYCHVSTSTYSHKYPATGRAAIQDETHCEELIRREFHSGAQLKVCRRGVSAEGRLDLSS